MAADIVDLSEYGRPFQMIDYEGGGSLDAPRHIAEVKEFRQPPCWRCGQDKHRANDCPTQVPRSVANDPV